MLLSELQRKIVVNTSDGRHLGVISDAEVNEKGEINYFSIAHKHFFKRLFKNEPDINIKISEIIKIGEDVILVEI